MSTLKNVDLTLTGVLNSSKPCLIFSTEFPSERSPFKKVSSDYSPHSTDAPLNKGPFAPLNAVTKQLKQAPHSNKLRVEVSFSFLILLHIQPTSSQDALHSNEVPMILSTLLPRMKGFFDA